MSEKGLTATSQETTVVPMYVETEQEENVARGCISVKELIAYEVTKVPRRHTPEKPGMLGEIKKDKDGSILYVEIPHKPCFCQTAEQERIFSENNSDLRIETFTIQLLKSTGIKFLDDPDNMKQFKEKK